MQTLSFTLIFYSLLGFSYGSLMLASLPITQSWTWLAAGVIGSLMLLVKRPKIISVESLGLSVAFAFVVLFLSNFTDRNFIFYNGSSYRIELLLLGVLGCFVVKSFKKELDFRFYFPLLLLVVQAFLITIFLHTAAGRILFSDDHPSFFYRLALLREHFPYIPFYNLDWNAGYSAREFFPSGVLNVFFLVAPFVYAASDFASIEGAKLYTYLIPYVYFFILPWSIYFAARVFGCSKEASTIAGIFSLGPSTAYFEWLLKYGTLGFSLSAGICPLTAALSMKLAIDEEKPKWSLVLLLLVVSFFSLAWSLSVTTLLPVIAISIIFGKRLFQKGRVEKIIAFVLLFLICNGPWIITFIQESKVTSFVGGNALPGGGTVSHLPSLMECLKEFRTYLQKINPALLFFTLPGLLLFNRKISKYVLAATIFWLLLVSGIGEYLKPQLELRRMVIPAAFFMCIPAGFFVAKIIEFFKSNQSIKPALIFFIGIIVFGVSIISPFSVATVLANRSDERFRFAEPEVIEFLEKVKKVDEGGGRIFFLGFILQEFGASRYGRQDGGHLAPLPIFTGKTFYASDYYHRHWSEVDPVPKVIRDQGSSGIEPFLDTVNASSVVTFNRVWADYCKSVPHYEQIFQVGRFIFFRRNSKNISDFLDGDGEIRKLSEGFKIKPKSERSVLKYRYLPRLKTSIAEGVEIKPFYVFDEEAGSGRTKPVRFIELIVSRKLIDSGAWVEISYHNRD